MVEGCCVEGRLGGSGEEEGGEREDGEEGEYGEIHSSLCL